MPVEINPKKYYKRKRKEIYQDEFNKEKLKQLRAKRIRREEEIRSKARDKAYHKFGMTKKQKAENWLKRIQDGIAKAQKSVEILQKDLENDLDSERHNLF